MHMLHMLVTDQTVAVMQEDCKAVQLQVSQRLA